MFEMLKPNFLPADSCFRVWHQCTLWMNQKKSVFVCLVCDTMFCILLINSQPAAPRSTCTEFAYKLLNPAGICMLSHGFVYMVFSGPMWISFYGFLNSLCELASADLCFCILTSLRCVQSCLTDPHEHESGWSNGCQVTVWAGKLPFLNKTSDSSLSLESFIFFAKNGQ